jgi:putative transposase
MSEKYKMYKGGLFFVTLTVVGWIDVFTRAQYNDLIIDNLNYCIDKKGLEIIAFCIMPSHIHLIARTKEDILLSDVLRDFKSFTSKKIISMIETNQEESRREWLLYMFKYFAKYNKHNTMYQFWQQNNHPIDLISNNKWIEEKITYIHQNPVKAMIVHEDYQFVYSSANRYTKLKIVDRFGF